MRALVRIHALVVTLFVVGISLSGTGEARAQGKVAPGATFTGMGTNLVVKDVAKSLAFYQDSLGFTVVSALPAAAPHVFAWVQRGGVNIFINDLATVQKDPVQAKRYKPGPGGIAIYILMTGVNDLFAGIKGKATVTEPIETKPYGSREFTITDPDGYVLTFSEQVTKP